MKKTILFFTAILLTTTLVVAQNQAKDDLTFGKTLHDFGSLVFGADGTYEFTFTNSSKKPVILTDVKSSCNCTVPTWTKEPIQPGATSQIRVVYNTQLPGAFNKTVSVYHTGSNSPVRLSVLGRVNAQPSDIKPSVKPGTVLSPTDAQKLVDQERELKYMNEGAVETVGVLPPDKLERKSTFEKKATEETKAAQEKSAAKTGTGEGGKIK